MSEYATVLLIVVKCNLRRSEPGSDFYMKKRVKNT